MTGSHQDSGVVPVFHVKLFTWVLGFHVKLYIMIPHRSTPAYYYWGGFAPSKSDDFPRNPKNAHVLINWGWLLWGSTLRLRLTLRKGKQKANQLGIVEQTLPHLGRQQKTFSFNSPLRMHRTKEQDKQ